MNLFFLLALFFLVSCGKAAPRHDLPVPDPMWAKNYVSQINKGYAPIFLAIDTRGQKEIIKVSFPYTTKNAYLGRILSADRKHALSINNHLVLDCFGSDGVGYTGCRIEIRGLEPGVYTFEY